MLELVLALLVLSLVLSAAQERKAGKGWLDILGSRALLIGLTGMAAGGALFDAGVANIVSMTSMLVAIPTHLAWSRLAARKAREERLEASRKRMLQLAESAGGAGEGNADLHLALRDEIDRAEAARVRDTELIRRLLPAAAIAGAAVIVGSWLLGVGAAVVFAWELIQVNREELEGAEPPLVGPGPLEGLQPGQADGADGSG